MIYTNEDKSLMDEIFRVFNKYIREHKNFDIVFSEKVGYVKIAVDPYFDEEIAIVRSPEEFLFIMFLEVSNDYLSPIEGFDYDRYRENVVSKISGILDTMDIGKEFAYDCYSRYRNSYRKTKVRKHNHLIFD